MLDEYDSSDEVKSEHKSSAPRKPSLRNESIPEPKASHTGCYHRESDFPRNFIKDLIGTFNDEDIVHLPEFLKCYENGGKVRETFDTVFNELNEKSHNALALRYIHNLDYKQVGERLDQEFGVNKSRANEIIKKQLRMGRRSGHGFRNIVEALFYNDAKAAVQAGMYQANEKTYLNLNDDQYEALADYMRENAVGKWSFESEPSDYDTIECVVTDNEIDFKTLREYAESENIKAYDTEEACLNDIDREIE